MALKFLVHSHKSHVLPYTSTQSIDPPTYSTQSLNVKRKQTEIIIYLTQCHIVDSGRAWTKALVTGFEIQYSTMNHLFTTLGGVW